MSNRHCLGPKKFFFKSASVMIRASCGCTVVGHSATDPEIEGSNPATARHQWPVL
jgi:hypothetical protein